MDLQKRVVGILTGPKAEWPVIAAEPTDIPALYKEYIAILALIPPLATFVGMTAIGLSVPMLGRYRVGLVRGLVTAVVQYVLALVGTYVAAVIIDKLAPTFKSESNQVQALKLVAYASTSSWVAGAMAIIPALAPLAILGGLYAIYLFYLGVGPLMKTPDDKVIPYMIVAAVVVIVVMFVLGAVTTAVTGGMAVGPRI